MRFKSRRLTLFNQVLCWTPGAEAPLISSTTLALDAGKKGIIQKKKLVAVPGEEVSRLETWRATTWALSVKSLKLKRNKHERNENQRRSKQRSSPTKCQCKSRRPTSQQMSTRLNWRT